MRFLITGTDTADSVMVRRDTAEAALKKAARTGSRRLDIRIGPDGRTYTAREFDPLARSAELPNSWAARTLTNLKQLVS